MTVNERIAMYEVITNYGYMLHECNKADTRPTDPETSIYYLPDNELTDLYNSVIKEKEEEKKMNTTGNTTAKAVLNAAGKNTFRFINFTLGIDFQKPVIIYHGSGNFTIKKLWDLLPHKNHDYNVAVIVPSRYAYNGHKIATINESGFDITGFYEISIYFDNKKTIPDTYNRKSDFEQDRKNASHYYMIAQCKEYAIPVKKREDCFRYTFNEYDRYIILNDEYNSSNSMYFRDIQKQGKKQYYSTGSNYYHEKDSEYRPVNWFDRSGYFVRNRRETLKNKARALHCEREKTKYLDSDIGYSQSKAIREQVVNLKAAIIKKLENETSYEKTKPITGLLYWDFEGILYDTELFIKRTAGKEYSSITSSTKAYTSIMEKINKTYNKLNETEGK